MSESVRKPKSTSGFTLMEMLIVVAIIAILVVVAMPIFSSSFQDAREKTDLQNAKSMTSALEAYYLTTTGSDALLASGTDFNGRGWIYVDKNGVKCNGNAEKALEAAGLISSSSVKDASFKGHKQVQSDQLKCEATSRWVKYQINFHKDSSGNLVFTYSASKMQSGTSSATANKQATDNFVEGGIGAGEYIEMG